MCKDSNGLHELFIFSAEPVGSVSPKKNTGDDIKVIWASEGNNIGILCPAQAYPTPIFRYELESFFSSLVESRLNWLKSRLESDPHVEMTVCSQ
jgi:hypothetical protein